MSGRDLYLIVCTAAISVLLTWFVLDRNTEELTLVTQNLAEKRKPDNQAHIAEDCNSDQAIVVAEEKQTNLPPQNVMKDNSENFILDAELQNRFSNFLDSQQTGNIGNLSAQIGNRFYEEEWNPSWAEDKENKIQQLFNQNKELENILPLDISCRSQNCQIVLPATSNAQIHELSSIFMQAVSNHDLGMARQSVSFFIDRSSSSLVFYVSENQHENLIAQ